MAWHSLDVTPRRCLLTKLYATQQLVHDTKNLKFRTKNHNFRWTSQIENLDDNVRKRGVRYIFPALPGARAGRPSPTT